MRIAQDVWWFSNLASCHREMGRADPCHPHSASQTAPHLHLNLPPPAISRLPLCPPPALQMSERMRRSRIRIPTGPPQRGGGGLRGPAPIGTMSRYPRAARAPRRPAVRRSGAGWCMLQPPQQRCTALLGSLRASAPEEVVYWSSRWERMRSNNARDSPQNVSSSEFVFVFR